ncbi:MAG: AAA family ATPase [Christensenella sp.]|nr:MAG: AAA family ATPase [Christensenella sp.]
MKQRLAIAVSLIANPSILVLDEPVNGLDPAGIFEVREILQYLNREEKITIIISSHILSELAKLATSYGIMDDGKIVKEMRDSDLEEMCRPYIKLVVGDLKTALNVIVEHYHAHDFEILPYNTLAIYDLSREIPDVVKLFTDANVPIMNVTMCQGDLESTFIALMGGLHDDEKIILCPT